MRQTHLEDLNSSTELKTDLKGEPIDSNNSPPTAHKGLQVGITVFRENDGQEQAPESATAEDQEEYCQMQINCNGQFQRAGDWQDVNVFWPNCHGKESMRDLFVEYSHLQYPQRIGADNLRPELCFLSDDEESGISYYKDFGWNPVQLVLKGDTAQVEILERYTRPVTLEQIPVDFMSDVDSILVQQGDKAVTSTLVKSPLQGHPLAKSLMTSETEIVVELRGLDSVVGVLGNQVKQPHEVDETTGDRIWRDTKSLRALLHGKPLPKKEGKGTKRTIDVVGLESFVKARVHYHASLQGDMVSDHGKDCEMMGWRWWKHPIQDMMNGFKVENKAKVYEDIELRFYSEIGYKMDNEYFEWEKHEGGRWIKVPKERTSIRMNLL